MALAADLGLQLQNWNDSSARMGRVYDFLGAENPYGNGIFSGLLAQADPMKKDTTLTPLGMASYSNLGSANNQVKPYDVVDGKLFYKDFNPTLNVGSADRISEIYQDWKNPEWAAQNTQDYTSVGPYGQQYNGFLIDPSLTQDPNFATEQTGAYRGVNTGRGITGLGTGFEKFAGMVATALGGAAALGPNGANLTGFLNDPMGSIGNMFNSPTTGLNSGDVLGSAPQDMSWLTDGVSYPSVSGVNPTGLSNYLAPELGGLTPEIAGGVGSINTAGLANLLAPNLGALTPGAAIPTPNSGVSVTSGGQTISQPVTSTPSLYEKAKSVLDAYQKANQMMGLLGGTPQPSGGAGGAVGGGGVGIGMSSPGLSLLGLTQPKFSNIFAAPESRLGMYDVLRGY